MYVQNKCALYWPEGDVKSETYNIYQGTITVTLKEKPIETSMYYIKRIFEVVKQQVMRMYICLLDTDSLYQNSPFAQILSASF